ncbi:MULTISPECIES: hypothetical protein [Leptolyngbya]|jgi:hypothetical protein|uniref:hypothetical protein n=1 Tax=Leptolyngbya TaxID=47251 RepID=UPI0004766ACA|nr:MULTISPECIES: hypothetical protein [Leptolyngbya]MBD2371104.1 hypothetical protein [Leptolyngbya sp. FACHB-161]MBD2377572.1 hypothetical protein [Leptolyngbya sp. FACHB-238]MBD2402025.1 hypothetical protein [Leptolyngbya sp. FACHB-239]MBD2408544.1 hypothetical protein [Leptolyngbya sp. FACHB-402]BAS60444.1 hypothetical protein LBWT_Y0320 [Leptolyngbya boryana IAM M-101]
MMFSPSKTDLSNDEIDVSDINSSRNVIELHPNSPDVSLDAISEEPITVSDFCQQYSITSDQFLALRRKAARKYPDLDFKPIREGSRTFWVQNAEILIQMIKEGAVEAKSTTAKKPDAIDGEIVNEQQLADGSSLIVRRQVFEVSLHPFDAPKTREFVEIDASPIQQLNASLKADQDAAKEAEKLTRLGRIANEAIVEKEQETLVRLLIKQGYSKEQAIRIASGIN